MIGSITEYPVRPDALSAFQSLARELAVKVQGQEPGCLTYRFYRPRNGATAMVLIEEYADEAAFAIHGGQPYVTELAPRLHALCEGAPDIRVYEAVE
ncbi:MAG: putative quinol monooxygenase [Maricaulaceae bacterium]